MQWERLAAFLSLLISIINGILAVFIYRHRRQPGAKGFLGLMIAIALYSFGYTFELAVYTVPGIKFGLDIEYLGITFIPFFWMVIANNYAGLEGRAKNWILSLLFFFSLLNVVIYFTNDLHHLYYSQLILKKHGAFVVADFHREPWYWVNLSYMILALFAGDLILIQTKGRTVPLFGKQINLLICGSLVPWLGYFLYIAGLSPWGLDLNPFSFSLIGLIAGLGLFHYQLFNLSPIARYRTFETMRDGVLILDLQDRIVDFNGAAQSILVDLKDSWIGHSVTDAFRKTPELMDLVLNGLELDELNLGTGVDARYIQSRLITALSAAKEPLGKIVILSDVTEQKQTQARIVHAEKMALLGNLASGVTRELTSSLLAIKNTAKDVERSFDQLWRQIPELLTETSQFRKQLFLEILEKLYDIPCLSTREERDSLQELSSVLHEQDWKNHGTLIHYFIKLGLAEDFMKFKSILQDPHDAALLEFVLIMALERKDVRTIIQAEERTSKINYALKSYSRTPDAERPVLTNIQAGVTTVLRMYGNIFKNGIQTTTHFQKVPLINAYPDKLQQVWTNLIHNAIQAMEGKGELDVTICQKGNEIMVGFTDNGPGISEAMLPLIFEPFFTTKKPGEGTGIGLPICKKIVHQHHGRIQVESESGRTQFSVFLPLSEFNSEITD